MADAFLLVRSTECADQTSDSVERSGWTKRLRQLGYQNRRAAMTKASEPDLTCRAAVILAVSQSPVDELDDDSDIGQWPSAI